MKHIDQVVAIVRAEPGLTMREVAARLQAIEPQDRVEEAHRRLADAARLGFVYRGPVAERGGRAAAVTWFPVERADERLL